MSWRQSSRGIAVAFSLALGCFSVRANDSAATLDAGGLVLVRDPEIELASEDLRIAFDRIDVAYVFHNRAKEPRTIRIAFPLPPIDGAELSEREVPLPSPDRANFVNFTVTVDGRAITPELEERAFLGTREVTETLRRHGLPLNPLRHAELAAALKRIDAKDLASLAKEGLLTEPMQEAAAQWRGEAKFHWEQTFPAGADLRIAHSYAPVTGSHFLSAKEAAAPDFRARYCLDDAGLAGIKRLAAAADGSYTRAFEVAYIVTTAKNWAGRIGRFTLTIDKTRPKALVSFCRDGVRKSGPTTFVWEAQDYVPDADLRVLIVSNDPVFFGDR